jgi:hypothetical protein
MVQMRPKDCFVRMPRIVLAPSSTTCFMVHAFYYIKGGEEPVEALWVYCLGGILGRSGGG